MTPAPTRLRQAARRRLHAARQARVPPLPQTTRHLLRACLATPEDPRLDDWAGLGDIVTVLKDAEVQRAGLLALLLHAAEATGVDLDPSLRSRLRAARLHAELRLEMIGPALRETLTEEAGVALRGIALAHTVYPHPALRHCHDLDLLTSHRADATVHPSGFPVSRHTSLFRTRHVGTREVENNTVNAEIAGAGAQVLQPADALVHVCAHAAARGRAQGLLWCVDVAMLLRSGVDLDRVHYTAKRWQVARPTARSLGYVRRLLG